MSAPPAPLQPPFAGTLGTLLRDRALAAPDSTLLIHRGAAISVGALAAAALQQAADLGAQGIAAGDRVVTMLDPGPDHVALVLALALAGAVWIPLSPEARGPSLVHALAAGCPFAAMEKQALLEAETVAARCRALITLLDMDAGGDDSSTLQ